MSAPLPDARTLIEAYGARTLPVWVEGDGYTLAGPPGTVERKTLRELAPELFELLDGMSDWLDTADKQGHAAIPQPRPSDPRSAVEKAAVMSHMRGYKGAQKDMVFLLRNLIERVLG